MQPRVAASFALACVVVVAIFMMLQQLLWNNRELQMKLNDMQRSIDDYQHQLSLLARRCRPASTSNSSLFMDDDTFDTEFVHNTDARTDVVVVAEPSGNWPAPLNRFSQKPPRPRTPHLYTIDKPKAHISPEQRWQWFRETAQDLAKRRYNSIVSAPSRLLDADPANFFWFLWPTMPGACEFMVRMGSPIWDGGKYVCNPHWITKPCTLLSFGVLNDWSFEEEVYQRLGCQVHLCDMSIDGKDIPPYLHFHKVGLGPHDLAATKWDWEGMPLKKLSDVVDELNLKSVDILKLDIEGAEWGAVPNSIETIRKLGVKQIMIEIHSDEVDKSKRPLNWWTYEVLEQNGYYPVMTEKTYPCSNCVEWVFVHESFLAQGV